MSLHTLYKQIRRSTSESEFSYSEMDRSFMLDLNDLTVFQITFYTKKNQPNIQTAGCPKASCRLYVFLHEDNLNEWDLNPSDRKAVRNGGPAPH